MKKLIRKLCEDGLRDRYVKRFVSWHELVNDGGDGYTYFMYDDMVFRFPEKEIAIKAECEKTGLGVLFERPVFNGWSIPHEEGDKIRLETTYIDRKKFEKFSKYLGKRLCNFLITQDKCGVIVVDRDTDEKFWYIAGGKK